MFKKVIDGLLSFRFGRKMSKREIVVNAENLETRVAVMESGRLEEYQVEHPTEERIVGGIYKARVRNLEDGLQAAFVDIGLKKNAFLHYWDMIPEDGAAIEAMDEGASGHGGGVVPGLRRKHVSSAEIAKRFSVDSEVVVQVTKAPIGTKGPRVTANLSVPGRYLVMMPGCNLRGVSRKIDDDKERLRLKKIVARLPQMPGVGLIVRTAGEGANQRAFVRDMRALMESWRQVQANMRDLKAPACLYQEPDLVERVIRDWVTEDVDRIVIDNPKIFELARELGSKISRRLRSRVQQYEGSQPIFEHFMIERQLNDALGRKVNLKSGGHLIFDETEALVAVDVNTGRHKGSLQQEDVIYEVNIEAVEEVARQLRLRNIGGLIVLDLIDMKSKKNRVNVYKALKDALRRDKARTNVLPISQLGLLEMTRQRVDEGVLSAMRVDCPYCHGRGAVKSALTMSVEIQRQIVAVMRRLTNGHQEAKLQITLHPTILDRLRREDEAFLVQMEKQFGGYLTFRGDSTKHIEEFEIRNPDTNEIYCNAQRPPLA